MKKYNLLAILIVLLMSGCSHLSTPPATATMTFSPMLTQTATYTLTATFRPTETKTSTPETGDSRIITDRTNFFVNENIDISRYKNINENERSLWGMIEWSMNNKDKVAAENFKIPVALEEYDNSLNNPALRYMEEHFFLFKSTNVSGQERTTRATYQVDSIRYDGRTLNTDILDRNIAGKEILDLFRGGYYTITGNFLGLGEVEIDGQKREVGIVDIINKGVHNPLIFAIPDPNLVLPKGYVCLERHGAFPLPGELNVGEYWTKYGRSDHRFLTEAVGRNITLGFYYSSPGNTYAHINCPDPVLGGELAADVRYLDKYDVIPFLPWGESVPSVIATPEK